MTPFNHKVAEELPEITDLLIARHANPFLSRAYLNAAYTLDSLPIEFTNSCFPTPGGPNAKMWKP